MPFCQAAAAAGGRGVLGDEGRMAAHRGLFPIISGEGRRQTVDHELPRVVEHHRKRLGFQIGGFLGSQAETAAELASAQGGKKIVEVAHGRVPRQMGSDFLTPPIV